MKTIEGNKSPVRTLSTPHLAPATWTETSQSPKRKTNMIASMFQSATGRSSSLSLASDAHREPHEPPHARSSSISGLLAITQRTRLKLLRQSSVVSPRTHSLRIIYALVIARLRQSIVRIVSAVIFICTLITSRVTTG